MGRKSIKLDKTIFQLSRENAGLTRAEAGEQMGFVTEDRIEKIEYERTEARPEEVLAMSRCYHDLTLCNLYCSRQCDIGRHYVQEIADKDLSRITLQIVASVNQLYQKRDRFIEISAHEDIPEEDMEDLIGIGHKLEELTHSIDSLKLWMKKNMLQDAGEDNCIPSAEHMQGFTD